MGFGGIFGRPARAAWAGRRRPRLPASPGAMADESAVAWGYGGRVRRRLRLWRDESAVACGCGATSPPSPGAMARRVRRRLRLWRDESAVACGCGATSPPSPGAMARRVRRRLRLWRTSCRRGN